MGLRLSTAYNRKKRNEKDGGSNQSRGNLPVQLFGIQLQRSEGEIGLRAPIRKNAPRASEPYLSKVSTYASKGYA
ncbi:MAG: hypothetical protein NVSMB31_11020 [Vulcanimicrobiaceae bacterium]